MEVLTVFMMILYCTVLSKCKSFSKDTRELQEESIFLIAPIERLTNLTLLKEREIVIQRTIFSSFTVSIILYISFKTYCKLKDVENICVCK